MRLVNLLLDNKPIRKVVVAGITAGVLFLAHHVLHVQIGPDAVNSAVEAALPIVAAYFTPDPVVRHGLSRV
jgi:stage V sporulation protein SpoVS